MNKSDDVFQNQILELRRGNIIIAVVGILAKKKLYGYALLKELEQYDVPIDGGTLYPLLRRLEKQEILSSSWEVTDNRPRKYYTLTTHGSQLHERLTSEWKSINEKISHILKEESWN